MNPVCTDQAPAFTARDPARADTGTTRAALLLPALEGYTRHEYGGSKDYRSLVSCDQKGNQIRLQTPYGVCGPYERPGRWYGSVRRIDGSGREWSSPLAHNYVVDNFGNLVAVPA